MFAQNGCVCVCVCNAKSTEIIIILLIAFECTMKRRHLVCRSWSMILDKQIHLMLRVILIKIYFYIEFNKKQWWLCSSSNVYFTSTYTDLYTYASLAFDWIDSFLVCELSGANDDVHNDSIIIIVTWNKAWNKYHFYTLRPLIWFYFFFVFFDMYWWASAFQWNNYAIFYQIVIKWNQNEKKHFEITNTIEN